MPSLHAAVGLLRDSWPIFLTLTPEMVGLGDEGETDHAGFLELVRSLSDDGLITYEALVSGPSLGIRVIDAALTARGRAQFAHAAVQSEGA